MASLRSLKKDIDYLLSLVLEECMFVAQTYPQVDEKKINELSVQVIEKHRELRSQVNHGNKNKDPKAIKEYYQNIVKELYAGSDSILSELLKLVPEA